MFGLCVHSWLKTLKFSVICLHYLPALSMMLGLMISNYSGKMGGHLLSLEQRTSRNAGNGSSLQRGPRGVHWLRAKCRSGEIN
jgi:hypothetical protein